MTFATIDDTEKAAARQGRIQTFGAAVLARINAFRTERKELKSIYHHHSEKAAILEQAQRDVNRVWQGPSFF